MHAEAAAHGAWGIWLLLTRAIHAEDIMHDVPKYLNQGFMYMYKQ